MYNISETIKILEELPYSIGYRYADRYRFSLLEHNKIVIYHMFKESVWVGLSDNGTVLDTCKFMCVEAKIVEQLLKHKRKVRTPLK